MRPLPSWLIYVLEVFVCEASLDTGDSVVSVVYCFVTYGAVEGCGACELINATRYVFFLNVLYDYLYCFFYDWVVFRRGDEVVCVVLFIEQKNLCVMGSYHGREWPDCVGVYVHVDATMKIEHKHSPQISLRRAICELSERFVDILRCVRFHKRKPIFGAYIVILII